MAAIAALGAFATALFLGRAAITIGVRIGLVDAPDDHLKPHYGRPVPLGGIAVLLGLHAGLALAGGFDLWLAVATLGMWSVGIRDDRFGVAPAWRIVIAGLAGVAVGVSQDTLRGWLGIAVAIVLVVVVVNAINLFDGMDGLVGSVGTVSALALTALAALRGLDMVPAIVLGAALVGFLAWNIPPARLFLGDNGAYVVGVTLVWVALRTSSGLASSLAAAALIGIPLLDLGATVVRRVRRRAALFEGDRKHSYDVLHGSGMSIIRVALTFSAAQTVWVGLIVAASWLVGDLGATMGAVLLGGGLVGWWEWSAHGWTNQTNTQSR